MATSNDSRLSYPAKIALVLCWTLLTGCTLRPSFSTSTATSTTTATPTPTIATTSSTIRAVQILFQSSSTGSFDSTFPSTNPSTLPGTQLSSGSPPGAGSGLQAQRLFSPSNQTLIASGGASSSTWPTWLTSFEIGLSGPSNTSAPNPNCANFASSTEATLLNCQIVPTPAPSPYAECGAPANQFRVSEVDCPLQSSTLAGNGGPSDGIYIRAQFNRSTTTLGPTENILVVISYSASSVNPAPPNPTSCFSGGIFTPQACSEFVWQAYLKHYPSETGIQPFFLLVPPTFASIINATSGGPQGSGTGIATKQFILPLAGDSTLTTLQISRTQPNSTPSNLITYCTPSGGNLPGDSPLCSGMVFYSMTFYRI